MNNPNGVHTPELVVNGSDHKPVINGHINGHTPTADSPNTPVSTIPAPDVKIEMDYQEQESDVRHEPIPIKSIQDSGSPADPCRFTSLSP